MADADGLFAPDAAANGAEAGGAPAGGAKERRIKLCDWDTVAAQVLNPYGPSQAEAMSLKALWANTRKKGNKAVEFHSELAADADHGGALRVGIGLSRLAESVLAGIAKLEDPNIAKLLKEEHLQKAKDEAAPLKAHLEMLHAGKGGAKDDGKHGFAQARKKARVEAGAGIARDEGSVKASAKAIHEWLAKPQSPLRSIFHILSCGGTFYAANIAEKVGRAWITQKPANVEEAQEAAWARCSQAAPEDGPAPADHSGLF